MISMSCAFVASVFAGTAVDRERVVDDSADRLVVVGRVADLVADGRQRRSQVDVDRVVTTVAHDVGLATGRLDVDPVEPWAGADEGLAGVRAVDLERVVTPAEQDVQVFEAGVGDAGRHVEAGDGRGRHGARVVVGLTFVDDEQPVALGEGRADDVAR